MSHPSSMKMSITGQAMLGLASCAVIVLMAAILMRAVDLEKQKVEPAEEQEMAMRVPLPAGPRRFQR